MIRLIKRYESRKLYDTEESRYVSLEDISAWVRDGQEVKVVDNATSADVTPQTLTQIILEEGRKRGRFLSPDLLHDLVRAGERAVTSGVEQVQHKMSQLVERSIDRLGPVRRAREEMDVLRERLEQLEDSLSNLETDSSMTSTSSSAAGSRSTSVKTAAAEKAPPAAKKAVSRPASRARKPAAKTPPSKAPKARKPAPKKGD